MLSIHQHFASLTREEILSLRPGAWGDFELLDVRRRFDDQRDDARAMVVVELILRSPEHSETLNYGELYGDLVYHYHWARDFPAALRWAHAWLAYVEQHAEPSLSRANASRALAETYLRAGEIETGLALFTRRLQAGPHDLWTYNVLGLVLSEIGLSGLAVEVLERALGLSVQHDPDGLKDQLTRLHREAVGKAAAGDQASEVSPATLAEFRGALALALTAPSGPRAEDEPEPYLPPIAQLLALGPERDESLYAAIRGRGEAVIPELIRLAFDEALEAGPGPAHAVALLRERRAAGAAELGELSAWLDQAVECEGWQAELLTLTPYCGKVGGYTTAELEAIAADTGYSTSARHSAVEALVERPQRLSDQREHIVAFLRTLLTRPEAYAASEETFVGLLIHGLVDLDAREVYPDIQRAFAEDRVDTLVTDLPTVHEKWGLSPVPRPRRQTDGLYLPLRCTGCRRVRMHFVQQVLVDVNTLDQRAQGQAVKHDPYIMDHEIVCPKCGATDEYALTPLAQLRLAGPENIPAMIDSLTGKKQPAEFKPSSRVRPLRSAVFGRPMHPLDGLTEYRRRMALNPNDAQLHLKLGNLLRTLFRGRAALAEHRQAYALNPNDAEIALACAMSEHDFGDRSVARERYQRVAALELKGRMGIVRSDTLAGAAFEGLDRLKQGLSSPAYTATVSEPPAPEEKTVTAKRPRKRRRR